jgi:hypothetical protein
MMNALDILNLLVSRLTNCSELESENTALKAQVSDLQSQLTAKDQALALAVANDQADETALSEAKAKLSDADNLNAKLAEIAKMLGVDTSEGAIASTESSTDPG